MPAKKPFIKPFKIEYFFWGHSKKIYKPDGYGFPDDLWEAYANAAKHLGRGSRYYKAIIIDRMQDDKPIAILTRHVGQITIKEF